MTHSLLLSRFSFLAALTLSAASHIFQHIYYCRTVTRTRGLVRVDISPFASIPQTPSPPAIADHFLTVFKQSEQSIHSNQAIILILSLRPHTIPCSCLWLISFTPPSCIYKAHPPRTPIFVVIITSYCKLLYLHSIPLFRSVQHQIPLLYIRYYLITQSRSRRVRHLFFYVSGILV